MYIFGISPNLLHLGQLIVTIQSIYRSTTLSPYTCWLIVVDDWRVPLTKCFFLYLYLFAFFCSPSKIRILQTFTRIRTTTTISMQKWETAHVKMVEWASKWVGSWNLSCRPHDNGQSVSAAKWMNKKKKYEDSDNILLI